MKKTLLFIIISILSVEIYAQNSDATSDKNNTSVVFINGINNTFDDATISQIALKNVIKQQRQNYTVNLAFNKKEGFLKDIKQVVSQKFKLEDNRQFWKIIDNFGDIQNASLIGQETYQKYVDELKNDKNLLPEIEDHLKQYDQDIVDGKKVVLVPHSQGNFYANASMNLMLANSKRARNQLFTVGLASPADRLLPNSSYITSSNDVLINSVRLVSPSTLKSNIRIPFSLYDVVGHSFNDTYLRKGDGQKAVLKNIITYGDAS